MAATIGDPAQYFSALDSGNAVRLARAEFKRRLRTGEVCPLAVLRDPPWYVQSMRAFELLECAPRFGQKHTRKINMRLAMGLPAVNLFAPVGELTEAQKEIIIEAAFPHGALKPNTR